MAAVLALTSTCGRCQGLNLTDAKTAANVTLSCKVADLAGSRRKAKKPYHRTADAHSLHEALI